MNKIKNRFFYHGAPCVIEAFDYKFTGRGTDGRGAGFNFASNKKECSAFLCENKITIEENLPFAPTVHKVRLNIENPLDINHVQAMTVAQCRELIRRAPDFEETLGDRFDIDFEGGLDKVLDKAAKLFSGWECQLLRKLNDLGNDFYRENIAEFNAALRDVLGYDGVIDVHGKDIYVVAWFPEQIEIVSRIDPTLELDEAPAP